MIKIDIRIFDNCKYFLLEKACIKVSFLFISYGFVLVLMMTMDFLVAFHLRVVIEARLTEDEIAAVAEWSGLVCLALSFWFRSGEHQPHVLEVEERRSCLSTASFDQREVQLAYQ
jgi:hypothetical protein